MGLFEEACPEKGLAHRDVVFAGLPLEPQRFGHGGEDEVTERAENFQSEPLSPVSLVQPKVEKRGILIEILQCHETDPLALSRYPVSL